MNLKQIEERMAAIKEGLQQEDVDVTALRKEFDELKEKRDAILAEAEERKQLLDDIANERIGVRVEYPILRDDKKEDVDVFATTEYRNAFAKTLLGMELTGDEKRAFLHTTENTGAVVPKELQNKIYSTMEEQHPILKDVQILQSGTVIQIVKHTAIVAGDADVVAEGAAAEDEENTFVDVTLSGKDFKKKIKFSYRLKKMAIPAFENYLVNELAQRIGSAMAKDIIAQIKSDLAAANKYNAETPGTLVTKDVLAGLAKLKNVAKVNIYANNATFYGNIAAIEDGKEKLTFINNLQENISAVLLGKAVKEEDALADGEVLFLDPQQFIYNVVQGIHVKKMEDEDFNQILTGIAIAEGSMTNDKAGALITVGQAG